MNWGGDKVWLAPQGWENEDQWPGPPDPVLDGGAYHAEQFADEYGDLHPEFIFAHPGFNVRSTEINAVMGRSQLKRLDEGNREQVLISVQDTGIGIPPDAIPSLFKNFNQVNSDLYGGTGLGLAVSQKLAELLNGEISVESRLSLGSEFTLRLPIVTQAIAAAA